MKIDFEKPTDSWHALPSHSSENRTSARRFLFQIQSSLKAKCCSFIGDFDNKLTGGEDGGYVISGKQVCNLSFPRHKNHVVEKHTRPTISLSLQLLPFCSSTVLNRCLSIFLCVNRLAGFSFYLAFFLTCVPFSTTGSLFPPTSSLVLCTTRSSNIWSLTKCTPEPRFVVV